MTDDERVYLIIGSSFVTNGLITLYIIYSHINFKIKLLESRLASLEADWRARLELRQIDLWRKP